MIIDPELDGSSVAKRTPTGIELKSGNWKDVVEAVGISAIVASLIFVGIEMRQSRAIAIGDGNLSNAEIQIESNNAINEYSELWIRGNSGDTLDDNEALIFRNLVRNKSIHAFMEYARLEQVEFQAAMDAVNIQFAIFLFQNPGARQVWDEEEEFQAQHFDIVATSHVAWRDDVRANLSNLDRGATL